MGLHRAAPNGHADAKRFVLLRSEPKLSDYYA